MSVFVVIIVVMVCVLPICQDDVASVSSRGVGPGSEIGELPGEATGDNTPQASGLYWQLGSESVRR